MSDQTETPEQWNFEVPSNTLPEIKAMAVIAGLAEQLDDDEIGRVLRWTTEKFANSGEDQ